MKQMMVTLSLILSFNFIFAQADMKSSMKEMGDQFKIIAVALQNKEISELELTAAQIMLEKINEVSAMMPKTAMTADQKALYSELMQDLKLKAEELVVVIKDELTKPSQDIDKIMGIFIELNEIRKHGHFEFKED